MVLLEGFEQTPFLKRKNSAKYGEKHNNLTVIGYGEYSGDRFVKGKGYLCLCDCGNYTFKTKISKLRSGDCKTCGCNTHIKKEEYRKFLTQYGHKLLDAGILYVSFEQWQTGRIPYWCHLHNEYSLKSKESIKKYTVAPCFKCGKEVAAKKRIKPLSRFIKDSIKIWGGRFSYLKTNYKGSHEYVIITCKEHGDFEQSATDHLCGNIACKGCSPRQGFNKERESELYVVKWTYLDKSFIKFGITNNDTEYRINKQRTRRAGILFKPEILNVYKFNNGNKCYELEKLISNSFETGVVSKEDFPDGFTETTYTSNYNKLVILIEDFIKGGL